MEGFEVLLSGGSALDAVQRAVEHLEADPAFNAGRGAVLNSEGRVELDAGMMDGASLEVGAAACVTGVVHPISLARGVMDSSPHSMLVGESATSLAEQLGLELCQPDDLVE